MFRLSTLKVATLTGLVALSTSACTTIPSFNEADYVNALDGASVVENKTRYSQALTCLKPVVSAQGPAAKRFAVGRVNDFTGKEDLTNGKRITQGAALMVISALAKAGVPMVERFDTSIADMELKYTDNKLITDEPNSSTHRKIFSGSLPGSDYHIVGGITEVNYNIRSGSLESSIRFFSAAARYFVMNVGIDLRVVNTKTLEVVNTQSLQKQIIGTELSGGYFRLFSDGLVDINAGERTQEPIQKAVRMVIEQAVFNIVSDLNNMPGGGQCAGQIAAAKVASKAPKHSPEQAQADSTTPAAVAVKAAPPAAPQQPVAATPAPAAVAQPVAKETPSSTSAKSAERQSVVIDPYTGEVTPAGNTSATAANNKAPNKNDEVGGTGKLNALFGSDAKTTSSPSLAEQSNSSRTNTREMQEKLLWGERAILR
jgi:holdfast attachment protein HfaB